MISIVVFEDNLADFTLMEISCEALVEDVELTRFDDEKKLFSYLSRVESEEISLFILDLNSSYSCGKNVLQRLRAMSIYNNHPIIIFSSSDHLSDILDCRSLGATAYMVKPNVLEDFEKIFRFIVRAYGKIYNSDRQSKEWGNN